MFYYHEIFKNTNFEELLRTGASELTLESDCLELYFSTVTFKTILTVISQKYQSLSNQSFKHSSAYMPCLYLTPTPTFEPKFRMLIINGYHTKSKHLKSLDSLGDGQEQSFKRGGSNIKGGGGC